jgi:hypothetical protein
MPFPLSSSYPHVSLTRRTLGSSTSQIDSSAATSIVKPPAQTLSSTMNAPITEVSSSLAGTSSQHYHDDSIRSLYMRISIHIKHLYPSISPVLPFFGSVVLPPFHPLHLTVQFLSTITTFPMQAVITPSSAGMDQEAPAIEV